MSKEKLPFGKQNYLLMIAGILTIVIGLFIMANDPKTHGFGFMGLTLGPIIVMVGFIVEFFAILYPGKSK